MTLLVYHGIPLPHCKDLRNSRYRAQPALKKKGRPLAHRFPLRVCKTIDLNVREGPATLGQGDVDTSEHLRLWERAAMLWKNVWKNIYWTGKLFGMHPWNIKLAWVQFDSLMYIYIYIMQPVCSSGCFFVVSLHRSVQFGKKDRQVIIPCLVQLSPSCLDSTDICSLWGTSFPCKTPLHNWIQSMKPFARIPQAATG